MKKTKHGTPRSRASVTSGIRDLQQEIKTQDHLILIEELCQKLNTDTQYGMTSENAAAALVHQGPNTLSPSKVDSEYVRLIKCMFEGFAGMMWISALLCFFVHGIEVYFDLPSENIELFGLVVIMICTFSGFFAYFQESKNINIINLFNKMAPALAMVIRNGQRHQILAEELVVGDLIEIKIGDKIPADIRITECNNLRVENSGITGEGEPKARTSFSTDYNLLETKNVAFSSSYAVAGSGKGIVIATGDRTIIGRLAGLTAQLEDDDTPIAKEIHHFINLIVLLALVSGFSFFILSIIVDGNIVKAIVYLLGIIIANIPEVLLVTVTTALTLTARKMADKNCLVKNLEAVETLGSTSTICSDKTGTLTQNKMTVSHLWYGNNTYTFPDNNVFGKQRDLLLTKRDFLRFLKNATLCLTADFKYNDEHNLISEREILGDASETGILRFCEHFHKTKIFRANYPKVAEYPFSSFQKYQLSIHKDANKFIVVVKGAPEVVLDFCSKIMLEDGNSKEMTPEDLEASKKAIADLGYLGERVLAYCDFELPVPPYNQDYKFDMSSPENFNFPLKDYIFVGFVSLVDPPRPSVRDAVYTCRRAGIKVIMVTGDHPVTAIAIAKKVGIIRESSITKYERSLLSEHHFSDNGDEAIVITGPELKELSEDELDIMIRDFEEIVFARTSPQQKLHIVESCKRIGEIVAVTGDGVNDSPALRKADIGVAMGISGSDVAKNAADMILLDDNFASIVTGIEEGRLIFDNLKKSITYTLTSSIPEMITMVISLCFSIPLPFTMELVLCIDLGTDLLPAIALAYEKAELDIMHRAPRNPQYDKLVNKRTISMAYGQTGMTQCMAGFYAYLCVLMFHGFLPRDLVGLREPWEDRSIDELTDSYGKRWDYKNRMDLLHAARTGYFVALVVMQVVVVIMCKTRRNSIFQQGMDNWSLNLSILFELGLTIMLLYVPGFDIVFKTMPLSMFWFLPCLPIGISLWIYDEARKWCIRRFPGGIIEEQTYY